jgi:DNA modification methylase
MNSMGLANATKWEAPQNKEPPAMPPASQLSDPPPRNLAVEYVPLDRLTLDPENARLHKPAQIRQIAKSITAFAFNAPILVDRDGKILAGHGRVMACRQLGWTEVPVIRLEHLTSEQARAFAIADNRLAENSSWDEAMLAGHFKLLSALDLDFDLETTGFSIGEIDLKILGLDDAVDDADDAPVPVGPPVARFGELWRLGPHKLLCGDSLDAATYTRLLGDERAAMVFTDPPYNVPIDGHVSGKGKNHHREFAMAAGEMSEPEFTAFLTTVCRLMAEASTDGALHYICMDWGHLFALMAAGRTAYDSLLNICVWAKPNGGMGGLYRSAHEMVVVFKHGRASHRNNVQLGRYGRNRTNVWSYPGSNSFARGEDADLTSQHPTPKPVAMIADAILDVTARGDLILDPFLGAGATLIAAERVGRTCRGVEMDPLYVDLTIRRWQRLTGEQAVRADGATFDSLINDASGEVTQ